MPSLRKLPAKFPRIFVRAGAVGWGVGTLVVALGVPLFVKAGAVGWGVGTLVVALGVPLFVRAGVVWWGAGTLVVALGVLIPLPCRSNLYYVILKSKPGLLLPVAALNLPGHLMAILYSIVQVPNTQSLI